MRMVEMCIRDRANDAFATIRITAKDSTEECYDEALDYPVSYTHLDVYKRQDGASPHDPG